MNKLFSGSSAGSSLLNVCDVYQQTMLIKMLVPVKNASILITNFLACLYFFNPAEIVLIRDNNLAVYMDAKYNYLIRYSIAVNCISIWDMLVNASTCCRISNLQEIFFFPSTQDSIKYIQEKKATKTDETDAHF